MKHLVLPIFLSLSLIVPAYAVDDGAETEPLPDPPPAEETLTTETTADDKNIIVNVTVPAAASVETPEPVEEEPEAPVETVPEVSAYTTYELDITEPEITDPERVTLKQTIVQLFGAYEPRTQTVTEYLPDGSTVSYTQAVPGVAGLDHEWLTGACYFGLMTFCAFKFLGGIWK